jgi:hypothetical protein
MYESDRFAGSTLDQGLAELNYMFKAPCIAIDSGVVKVQGYGVLDLISLEMPRATC